MEGFGFQTECFAVFRNVAVFGALMPDDRLLAFQIIVHDGYA